MKRWGLENTRKNTLEEYLSHIDDLPTLPHVVIQLMTKIHESEPNVDELADLVMTDQVLTTRLMRLVNSAFWGLSRKITSVKETIVYLGLREIQNLIYSVTLANTFERDAPHLKRVRFWEHSFGCALYSRFIAKKIGYLDLEQAYLAGLLHDIGEVIIALHFYQEFEKVVELVRDKSKTFYRAEQDVMGIDHTDFGRWLVKKWKLPEKLFDVIVNHHSIEQAVDNKILVAIVRLADLICLYHKLDFGYAEGEDLSSEIIAAWRFLSSCCPNLDYSRMKPFLRECNAQIGFVRQTVKTIYKIEMTGVA